MGLDISLFLALALSILSSASKQTGLTFPNTLCILKQEKQHKSAGSINGTPSDGSDGVILNRKTANSRSVLGLKDADDLVVYSAISLCRVPVY